MTVEQLVDVVVMGKIDVWGTKLVATVVVSWGAGYMPLPPCRKNPLLLVLTIITRALFIEMFLLF
jgi:hypothetical protein